MNPAFEEAISVRDYRTFLPLAKFTPKDIEGWLHGCGGIVGQNAACKAVASLLYNHFHYPLRPKKNLLLIGPTGCGKTRLINALQEFIRQNVAPNSSPILVNGFCRVFDTTQCQATGWHGGLKLYNLLVDMGFMGCLLVLDEWDKTIKTTYGSSPRGTICTSTLLQQNFLTLFDHLPSLTYVSDDNKRITVDGQKVSIICMGAFSELRENRQREHERRSIGFAGSESTVDEPDEISEQDLIAYGMMSEIASRMSDPVIMDALTLDDLVNIGRKELDILQKTTELQIHIDDEKLLALAETAHNSGLGGRYIKSQLGALLDDHIYENPCSESFSL